MLIFWCFQDIKWNYTQKAVYFSEFVEKIHQICWFFGNDFHLQMAPGVRKPLGVTQRKKILQKFINLEKILEFSEKFSIIFVVFRISNGITLKRQSIFNFFKFLAVIFAFLVSGFPMELHSEVHFFKIS